MNLPSNCIKSRFYFDTRGVGPDDTEHRYRHRRQPRRSSSQHVLSECLEPLPDSVPRHASVDLLALRLCPSTIQICSNTLIHPKATAFKRKIWNIIININFLHYDFIHWSLQYTFEFCLASSTITPTLTPSSSITNWNSIIWKTTCRYGLQYELKHDLLGWFYCIFNKPATVQIRS